jgi:hypothetical protein
MVLTGKGLRPTGQHKLLAARLARDLMIWWSSRDITLTGNGHYITLTRLLFKVATGREVSKEVIGTACRRHFKDVKNAEGFDPYSKRGRRGLSASAETQIERMSRAATDEAREQRVEAARRHPSLDELLDEMGVT